MTMLLLFFIWLCLNATAPFCLSEAFVGKDINPDLRSESPPCHGEAVRKAFALFQKNASFVPLAQNGVVKIVYYVR